MGLLADRALDKAPIKAPAMNITLGSAGILSVGTALAVWKQAYEYLFGEQASEAIRERLLIATIAAIAVIAAADMLARAIAARQDPRHIMPWGKGWTASISQPGADETGYIVAAMRASPGLPERVEYLLVKAGEAPVWKSAGDVTLSPPAASS